MGMGSGWERFDFNKDAPLDDDEDATEGMFCFYLLLSILAVYSQFPSL